MIRENHKNQLKPLCAGLFWKYDSYTKEFPFVFHFESQDTRINISFRSAHSSFQRLPIFDDRAYGRLGSHSAWGSMAESIVSL